MRKLFKNISTFINDFYNMFCGNDGRLSIRRFLGAVSFATLIYVCIYSVHKNVTIMESVIWALVALVAGFYTLTTISSGGKLKDLLDGKEKNNNNSDGGN
jgi:hypothetical protein